MKTVIKYSLLFCLVAAAVSCKKDTANAPGAVLTTAVNVVNAAVNVPAIKAKINGLPVFYALATQVAYGAGAFMNAPRSASAFTVISTADTTTAILNANLNFSVGVYSFFIAGQSPTIDTLVVAETIYPYIHNDPTSIDSSINIRFVNLSPNSSPVNINIKGSTATETTNLAYKGYTTFKNYAAKLPANPSYIFEVRDAVSNTVLTTFTLSITATNRFKNVAIVIKGLAGTTTGTNAFGAFAANYF